jgi:hypothetical protein
MDTVPKNQKTRLPKEDNEPNDDWKTPYLKTTLDTGNHPVDIHANCAVEHCGKNRVQPSGLELGRS